MAIGRFRVVKRALHTFIFYRIGPSQKWKIGKAEALACCWIVRELGMTRMEAARYLKIVLPTASTAVSKGEKIARDQCLIVQDFLMKINEGRYNSIKAITV